MQDRRFLIPVLYGSQTGTAQDTAERIGRTIRRHRLRARVLALDDFDRSELLDQSLVIFVCATTGQGDEPTNMKQFWQFMRRSDLPDDLLEGLMFTILGLGDSSYPKYNWVAKKLQRRLEQLGAASFFRRGEADEQDYLGIDTTLNPWLDGLMEELLRQLPLPPGVKVIPPEERPSPRLRISRDIRTNGTNGKAKAPERTSWATMISSERATAPHHFQDTRYIELELDDPIEWEPGDVIEFRPENPSSDVDDFVRMLKWEAEADTPFEIAAASEDQPLPAHWPHTITLREMLTKHLDIFSVPRRSFFEFLAYFTTDDQETDRLREFCSAQGQEDMYDYAHRPRRTIAEVLQEFRSARIPLEYVADIFPEIRPRQFSIASSCRHSPGRVSLLIAVVRYQTKLRKPRQGVCTTWLSRLRTGARIPVSFSAGSMRLPADRSNPIILIGPGTGVAPFRAFLQDRKIQQADANLLVFGCRSVFKDFYYQREWTQAQERSELELVVAASRDQDRKIYVQHKLREVGTSVFEMLENGAYVYISGAADKMPKAVRETLCDIMQEHGKLDDKHARAYMEELETSGRLQEETWS